jgi:hypothetical protein
MTQAFDQEDRASEAAETRLASEIAKGPFSYTPDPSNFEAAAEAAFRERQFSRDCNVCKGVGERDLGKRRMASYQRRFKAAGNEDERRNIRKKLSEEAHCHACDGTGKVAPPDRRNGMQRTLCEDCRGSGDDAHGNDCERCLGLGHVCLGKTPWWVTNPCPRCNGARFVVRAGEERICGLCRGEGVTVPITAMPHGSSKQGFGPDVGAAPADASTAAGKVLDEVADRDVEILAAFDSIRGRDERLARVLATFRGPLGDRWGKGHPYGRAFAVWPETESGRKLLQIAPERLRRELGTRPLELLAIFRDEEELARIPRMHVRALITRADREAQQLVRAARAALVAEAFAVRQAASPEASRR